jgi:hypothetical protein
VSEIPRAIGKITGFCEWKILIQIRAKYFREIIIRHVYCLDFCFPGLFLIKNRIFNRKVNFKETVMFKQKQDTLQFEVEYQKLSSNKEMKFVIKEFEIVFFFCF